MPDSALPRAALELILHALLSGKPACAIVIGIDKGNIELFRKTLVFVFAPIIFLMRMDVGVVKNDRDIQPHGLHRFHDRSAARGAAGMQEYLVFPVRLKLLHLDVV
jgi:hypothetical protein